MAVVVDAGSPLDGYANAIRSMPVASTPCRLGLRHKKLKLLLQPLAVVALPEFLNADRI